MKIKILKSVLAEGLKSMQNIVSTRLSSPVMQNVLLSAKDKTLTMTTTDLDLTMVMDCACETEEEGATTLPVKVLTNWVMKAVEGVIELEADSSDRSTLKAGNSVFKIQGISEKEFPTLPVDEEAFGYKIEEVTLKEMIRKVSYATSLDDTRKTLMGVLMKFKDSRLTMVATDGRRLAMVEKEMELPANEDKEIVLPFKTVQELQRSLNGDGEVTIATQQSQVFFKTGNMKIYSKLIDEKYPNYQQVIPTATQNKIEVDRQLFIDAIDRASVMMMGESRSIKLIFSPGKMVVTSTATELGESKDELPIKYAGEEIEAVFNPAYILDALKNIDDDEVSINLDNGHSPVVLKCSIPFVYVMMPLRIS